MAPDYTVAAHFHVRARGRVSARKAARFTIGHKEARIRLCSCSTWSGATKPPSTDMLPRRTYRGPNKDWRKRNCLLNLPANGTSIGFEGAGGCRCRRGTRDQLTITGSLSGCLLVGRLLCKCPRIGPRSNSIPRPTLCTIKPEFSRDWCSL